MKTALEGNATTLQLATGQTSDYATLANQLEVAAAVLRGKPQGGYADATAIQTVFDNTVTGETNALAAVNAATDDATMQSALENNAAALDLDLTHYNALVSADKTAVAHAVYSGKGSGYANVAAVQIAFDLPASVAGSPPPVSTDDLRKQLYSKFLSVQMGQTTESQVDQMMGSFGSWAGVNTYTWYSSDLSFTVTFDTDGTAYQRDCSGLGHVVSQVPPTVAEFHQIQEHMTYAQVSQIMGCDGQLMTEIQSGAYDHQQTYAWSGSNNTLVTVSFINNLAVHWSQVGFY